ncbi:DUF4255 domain-containing protein [Paenibacillus allorhizosphaerae]|uniref:Pvc16 N-terminal domain-containing protein n=1 Tax=Paenibacillus allorhizosphaerae TaxID=2849866 RepID=A0ABN7TJV7_9BACL|nr:DUF4255 domain-containing protein [Paenibacillus allorhizosphaerae]CAG7640861.1 hypothetical protein PAECIP111802_02691 [Paenibacillus allorhizosphaerae]
MSQYTVIADVGNSIVELLREQMTPEPVQQPEYIGLSSPVDKGDLSLSIYLFRVQEAMQRRHDMISRGAGVMQYPPMTIELQYLITAHSTAALQSRAADEQRILGRAMQVLYDYSVIKAPHLLGTLADSNEELHLVMSQLPMDTLVALFPNTPYKLSVCYTVGPVYIDSTRTKQTKRVLDRNIVIQG